MANYHVLEAFTWVERYKKLYNEQATKNNAELLTEDEGLAILSFAEWTLTNYEVEEY